jgi:cyclic pyranopterin phosphate synthase
MNFSHVNEKGEARMVDIGGKPVVRREAEARGKILLKAETLELIRENRMKKGDVLSAARIAAISGGKKTSELIPLCHNIPINHIEISFEMKEDSVEIIARASCDAKTGIEMETLTAVSIAALTIYDMCKSADKEMVISDIRLISKSKG